MKKTISFSLLFLLIPFLASHNLENAISSDDRDPKNKMRDSARNPLETLSFFEIEQDMTVVELSPGGGWYTEILANYLHDPGKLIAAQLDKDSQRAYFKRRTKRYKK